MTGPGSRRGVALITAMLITALVSSVAAGLSWNNALDTRRTMVLLFRDQAVQVALGAESWVQGILRDDLQFSSTDDLDEIWAQDLPPLPLNSDSVQGEVLGKIEDLQGRFNINNLIDKNGSIDPAALGQFRRLLQVLGLDPRIAGVAADWMDSDQNASFPDGAEDPIYTALTPPYRTADQTLTSISELLALDGMDKATFDILAPNITALPGHTTINVNTATPAVLQSLDDNLTAGDVEQLLTQRQNGGFQDLSHSFSALVRPEVLKQLDLSSEYFQLKVVVQIDTVRIVYFSVLQRGPQGDVTPILRSIGTT